MQTSSSGQSEISLFRQEAVESAGQSLFGKPSLVVPPAGSILAIASLVIFTSIGVVSWITHVPVSVTATGMLMPPGGALDVVAPETGEVTKLFIEEGDSVLAGDSLLDLSPDGRAANGDGPDARKLESLLAELAVLESIEKRRRQAHQLRLDSISETVAAAQRRFQQTSAQQSISSEEIAVITDRLERKQSLSDTGHVSKDAVDQERVALLRAMSTAAV